MIFSSLKNALIRTIEYILFYIFVCIFLLTLLVFDVIQRIGGLFGRQGIEITEYWFNLAIVNCLRITGTRFLFTYHESVPDTGPVVIVSNHQSMFDISTIFVALKKLSPRFVSKKELASGIPGVSICLKLSNADLIDRKDPSQAIPEIKRFAHYIKQIKKSAVIFPEGTRARDGILKSFKRKGSEFLIQECIPCYIQPIAIDGSWKLQKNKYGPFPLGTTVKINCLPKIHLTDKSQIPEILNQVELSIKNELNNLRG